MICGRWGWLTCSGPQIPCSREAANRVCKPGDLGQNPGFRFFLHTKTESTGNGWNSFLRPHPLWGGVTPYPLDAFGDSPSMSLASRFAPLPLRNPKYASVDFRPSHSLNQPPPSLVYATSTTLCPPLPSITTSLFHSRLKTCLLYTSPSPRDGLLSRMPSSA